MIHPSILLVRKWDWWPHSWKYTERDWWPFCVISRIVSKQKLILWRYTVCNQNKQCQLWPHITWAHFHPDNGVLGRLNKLYLVSWEDHSSNIVSQIQNERLCLSFLPHFRFLERASSRKLLKRLLNVTASHEQPYASRQILVALKYFLAQEIAELLMYVHNDEHFSGIYINLQVKKGKMEPHL